MIRFHLASGLVYLVAAIAEIAGCFAFWMWLRQGRSAWWLVPAMISLAIFAYLLTRIDVGFAGRTYAAYGGIYIAASLGWLWLVEGTRPTGWDLGGAVLTVAGAIVILTGAQLTR